jgi:hypothetical protein
MADTIRSLVELSELIPDNVIAAISPQDIRDLMVSQMVHGEIGSGAKAQITLGSTWQALDLDVAGVVGRGLTVDTINRRLADVPVEMKAIVHCEIVFRGAQNTNYEFAVFRNTHATPEQELRLTRTLRPTSNTNIVAHSWSTSLQFAQGDSLQFGVRANGQPFELLFAVLRFQRIGVE